MVASSLLRPPGLVSAVVGGVLGGGVGVWVSILLSEQFKAGDLSDIGTGLVLLLAGLVVGPSLGSTIALAIRKHDRALFTGLLVAPLMFAAIIGGFAILGFLTDVAGLRALLVLVALAIAAIWMARWLTAR